MQMNSWRSIADMMDSRAYGSSASLGSTVFAVGGLQSDMQASYAGCWVVSWGSVFKEGGILGHGCSRPVSRDTHC